MKDDEMFTYGCWSCDEFFAYGDEERAKEQFSEWQQTDCEKENEPDQHRADYVNLVKREKKDIFLAGTEDEFVG